MRCPECGCQFKGKYQRPWKDGWIHCPNENCKAAVEKIYPDQPEGEDDGDQEKRNQTERPESL